ncbi:MAG: hypothetical protein GXO07_02105 [Crenarchaeota archaeon]|nr:hypothetical protein [Thermoproteota archaeon]
MSEEARVLERVNELITMISSCRVRYLARALVSLTLILGSTLTALTAALIPDYFTSNIIIGTALLLFLILFYSSIMLYTFKKTFTYTFGMASLVGEEAKLFDALLFPAVMLAVMIVSNYLQSPQLLMSSPFIGIAILKITSRIREKVISGSVLLSLSMISSVSKVTTLPAALASAYAISSMFETLMNLEEAERCVYARRAGEA